MQAITKSIIGTKTLSGFELKISLRRSIQIGDKAKIIKVNINWNKINLLTINNWFFFLALFKRSKGVTALKKACSIDLKIANSEDEKVMTATASSPRELRRIDRAKISIKYFDESVGNDSHEYPITYLNIFKLNLLEYWMAKKDLNS